MILNAIIMWTQFRTKEFEHYKRNNIDSSFYLKWFH